MKRETTKGIRSGRGVNVSTRAARLLVALVVGLGAVIVTAGAGGASGFYCFGRAATKVGTSGPDTIIGTAGDDVLMGLSGSDTIKGRGGRDRICGGANDPAIAEVLMGASGRDFISGGAGADTINGERDSDRIRGGEGADDIRGAFGDDVVWGEPRATPSVDSKGTTPYKGEWGTISSTGSPTVTSLTVVTGTMCWKTPSGGPDELYGEAGDDSLDGFDSQEGFDVLDGGPHLIADTCNSDPGDSEVECEL